MTILLTRNVITQVFYIVKKAVIVKKQEQYNDTKLSLVTEELIVSPFQLMSVNVDIGCVPKLTAMYH